MDTPPLFNILIFTGEDYNQITSNVIFSLYQVNFHHRSTERYTLHFLFIPDRKRLLFGISDVYILMAFHWKKRDFCFLHSRDLIFGHGHDQCFRRLCTHWLHVKRLIEVKYDDVIYDVVKYFKILLYQSSNGKFSSFL